MKRDTIITRITEAVDGLLSGDELRELIEALEHHPDLENEFHAQMNRPDIARAYETVRPRPGFELRLAARMEPETEVPGLEQEIIRFFRRYVLAGGLAAVFLFMTVIPSFQTVYVDDAETIETWLYGNTAEELISEAGLPNWIDYPAAGELE
jgi:hypothetical protein